MPPSPLEDLEITCPVCRSCLAGAGRHDIVAGYPGEGSNRSFDEYLKDRESELGELAFLPELALLERTAAELKKGDVRIPSPARRFETNPSIRLETFSWQGLAALLEDGRPSPPRPVKKRETVLVWLHPATRSVMVQAGTDADWLALKIAAEGIDTERLAEREGVPLAVIEEAMSRAVEKGLVLAPRSRIRRNPERTPPGVRVDEEFLESPFFTIQLHITQDCDLRCKHCYDRSRRSSLGLEKGTALLDELREFCRDRHVRGQVSFSGGNPLLHPGFFDLYRAAVERGFVTAVLGNPTSRENLERILRIRKPAFYQVSLEGLREHNDAIRGKGSFDRVLRFLPLLRECGIPSLVMLTLTGDNMDQVIPLGERLKGLTDGFTFNRLAQVGEGANLRLPARDGYQSFLASYLKASERNPVLTLKDNLFNILLRREGKKPFGGCAGYGCSAAFNFLAVLPDGEVHACRKFPSLVGNIHDQRLADIYDSEPAERYRRGTAACRTCPIRPVCGSCLAVMYGQGMDIFNSRDPHCFMEEDLPG